MKGVGMRRNLGALLAGASTIAMMPKAKVIAGDKSLSESLFYGVGMGNYRPTFASSAIRYSGKNNTGSVRRTSGRKRAHRAKNRRNRLRRLS